MKKILSILLIAVCLCILPANRTQAAADPNAERFQEALDRLDYFYDYNYDYMISTVADIFVEWGEDMWKLKTMPAAEYDAVLHKYFVLTDRQIQELREYGNQYYSTEIHDEETWEVIEVIPFFDEVNQTYTFSYYGGFGGIMPEREYLGYVQNGDTYDVYYHHIRYAFLQDYLPEGVDVWEYVESLDYPEYIELEGLRFEDGPDGYYTILGYDDFGRKYTVEYHEDVVRIISCVDYTAGDLPDSFDDRELPDVTYDLPESGDISISENECFADDTIVKVEQITDGSAQQAVANAMQTVAERYVAYEFTATKDNVAVQPNGRLTVTFAIPASFSDQVALFYLAESGALEKLEATVQADQRTVTVELEHFSTYILADEASKPHVHSYESVVTVPTCTEDGCTTYTCACGHSYTDSQVAATGHSFGQWSETKAPTYTEEGEEKRTCDGCGQEEKRAIPKLTQTETQPSQPNQETQPADGNEQADDGNSSLVWILLGVAVAAAVVAAILVIRKKK